MRYYLLLFLLFDCLSGVTQIFSLKGSVTDGDHAPLCGAVVELGDARQKRVVCVTGKSGFFEVDSLAAEKYWLSINLRGYGEYADTLFMASVTQRIVELPPVRLFPAVHMLDEVQIIHKMPPVVQKDDTTEYSSAAYKVNPDADAADLVRKMPGLDISGSSITAQGESVVKVLVDGRPFFGSDPYAALKNLPANVIDKVQVYNEKSDQEQFTGFSENNTSKTVNIITKADKRNGVFGAAHAAGGGDESGNGKFNAGATLNSFDNDRRFTFTGEANNVNTQSFTSPDAGSSTPQSGTARVSDAGVNYSDKWGKGIDVGCSYFFNQAEREKVSTLRKSFVSSVDSGDVYNENSASSALNLNHRFNSRINCVFDTFNSLLWQSMFSANSGSGHSMVLGGIEEGTTAANRTLNASRQSFRSLNFSSNLLFRHKFNKVGRTFSTAVNAASLANASQTFHYSQNQYFNSPMLSDTLNQLLQQNLNNCSLNGNITYTEPIGGHGLLKLEGSVSYMPVQSANAVYDYSYIADSYVLPDSIYSSSLTSNNLTSKAGGSYQLQADKLEISAGLYYQDTRLTENQPMPVSYALTRQYVNILPVVMLRYKFSKTRSIQLNYNASTQAPTASQLAEVVNNTNPLFLTTGNASLQMQYKHTIIIRYRGTGSRSKSNFSATLSGNYEQCGISSSAILARADTFLPAEHVLLPEGSQLSIPVEVSGMGGGNCSINYGVPLSALKCNIKFSLVNGYNSTVSFINGFRNIQQSKNSVFGAALTSNISEGVDFTVSSATSFVASKNSMASQLNATYVNEVAKVSLNLILFKKLVVASDILYQTNSGLSAGYNTGFAVWNLGVARKLFKRKQAEIRCSVFDILNQASNVLHIVGDTYYEDTRTNIVQRYLLLSFAYKVQNFKKSAPRNQ